MIGSPPSCRPECYTSDECELSKACLNSRCVSPCDSNPCARDNSICSVTNHNAICTCRNGYIGDPFVQCTQRPYEEPHTQDPCQPSPCGPHSECRNIRNTAACSCLQGYIGKAPNCRPECVNSADCPLNLACVNYKCIDPCIGVCGINSECRVHMHSAVCLCRTGYTGDPFSACSPIPYSKIFYFPFFPFHILFICYFSIYFILFKYLSLWFIFFTNDLLECFSNNFPFTMFLFHFILSFSIYFSKKFPFFLII